MNLALFLKALGLAFILEGIPYFLFAERMPAILRQLLDKPPATLRKIGTAAMVMGLLLVYLSSKLFR
jgi:hypothetical protein